MGVHVLHCHSGDHDIRQIHYLFGPAQSFRIRRLLECSVAANYACVDGLFRRDIDAQTHRYQFPAFNLCPNLAPGILCCWDWNIICRVVVSQTNISNFLHDSWCRQQGFDYLSQQSCGVGHDDVVIRSIVLRHHNRRRFAIHTAPNTQTRG